MSAAAAHLALLLLVAIPLWTQPTAIVVTLATAAAALLLYGLRRPSILAASGGGAIAAAAYALALWSAAAPAGIVEPLAFGTALLLALRHADFVRTFRGAEVPPVILRDAVQRWVLTAGVAAAAVLVLIGAVTLIADGAPLVWRPVLAGAGAFLALAAAVAVLRRSRPQ